MADKSKYSNPQEFSGQVDISGPLTTSGTGTHTGHQTMSQVTTTGAGAHSGTNTFTGHLKSHLEADFSGSAAGNRAVVTMTGSSGRAALEVTGSSTRGHAVPAVNISGSMTFTSGSVSTHVLVPIHGVGSALAAITHTGGGNLLINTLNIINVSAGAHQTFNMPAVAQSKAGDTVIVKYVTAVPNSYFHKYDTDASSFDPASFVFRASPINDVSPAGQPYLFVTSPNGSSNDVFTVTGSTNGGCGPRSQFNFVHTGTTWRLWDGIIHPGGSGVNGGSGSFGNT
jgi:hypothetical protein